MANDGLWLLVIVLLLAVAFDFINGFHDTANAIATVVATRVLSPMQAIIMAASLNFAGAMTGTAVAKTIATGLIDPRFATQQLIVAALLAAITWNLITWFYGIPSSSSHALMGSIIGSAIATAHSWQAPKWDAVVQKMLLPLIVSPLLGFAFAWIIMVVLLRVFIKRSPREVQGMFGKLQIVSSAFMAFSHGGNDAQKTMGIMALAVAAYTHTHDSNIPTWIKIVAALAMGCGTAAGGWRVIKTMGHKLTRLEPMHGFCAETGAATIIEIASRLGFPLSTTHVISTSIMGVGASRGFHAVRWNVAGGIVTAWLLTIPACMILAMIFTTIIHLVS